MLNIEYLEKCLFMFLLHILCMIFFLFIQKCLGSGMQATGWAKELSSVTTACRHGFHNGVMACMLQIGESAIRRFFVAWLVFWL